MKTITRWYRRETNERVKKSQVLAETKNALKGKYIPINIDKFIKNFINANFYCIKGEKNYEETNNGIHTNKK